MEPATHTGFIIAAYAAAAIVVIGLCAWVMLDYRAQRRTLPREFVSVSTDFGNVRIKLSRVNGRILHVAPEYDDCRKLAVEKNVPLQRVISEALRAYELVGKSN